MATRFDAVSAVRWFPVMAAALICCLSSAVADKPEAARDLSARPLMPGDRVRITVMEDADLTKVYSVAGDGTIDFTFLGRVSVDNLTPREAAARLKDLMEKSYYKKATVSLEVAEFVEGSVMMVGAVVTPGALDFKGDQILTLMEAIAMSGGLAPDADAKNVRIIRWQPGSGLNREIISVDVKEMVDKLEFGRDQFLRPRDMVFVPKTGAGTSSSDFLALGQFGSPGFHPHQPGMDVIRAVAAAGGVTRWGKLDSVRLLRQEGRTGQYTAIPLDLSRLFGAADMSVNIPVEPGDVIFAPELTQSAGGRIYLLGEVTTPGIVPLSLEREATLARTLLTNGGGLTKFANASRVRIQRMAPDGKRETLEVNVERILKTGSFEEDVPLRDEDVIIVPERLLF